MSIQKNEELTLDDLEQTETEAKLESLEVETSVKLEKELVVVTQLPIIRQTLEAMSAEIKKETEDALALICTEETVKIVKGVRTNLTKKFAALDAQRIAIKDEVLKPYDELNKVFRELITDPYKTSDILLQGKVNTFENELKSRKEKDCLRYFAELSAAESIDFVSFEQIGLNITLSVTLPALKKQIAEFVARVDSDLQLIDTQEFKSAIMVEYKKSLNCSRAITDVVSRHKALEEEKIRQAEREAARSSQNERVAQVNAFLPPPTQAPVTAPQEATAPLQSTGKEFFVTFKAWGTKEVLTGLKGYLVQNKIRYENVPAPVNTVEAMPRTAVEEMERLQRQAAAEKKPELNKDVLPVAFVTFKNKEGVYGGREYSYVIPDRLIAEVAGNCNCFVDVATKHGIVSGLVTRLGSTADVAAEIIPKLMKLEGITVEKEEDK